MLRYRDRKVTMVPGDIVGSGPAPIWRGIPWRGRAGQETLRRRGRWETHGSRGVVALLSAIQGNVVVVVDGVVGDVVRTVMVLSSNPSTEALAVI